MAKGESSGFSGSPRMNIKVQTSDCQSGHCQGGFRYVYIILFFFAFLLSSENAQESFFS